jgi:hypothetical protein
VLSTFLDALNFLRNRQVPQTRVEFNATECWWLQIFIDKRHELPSGMIWLQCYSLHRQDTRQRQGDNSNLFVQCHSDKWQHCREINCKLMKIGTVIPLPYLWHSSVTWTSNIKALRVLSRRIDVPYEVTVLHCSPAVSKLASRRFDFKICDDRCYMLYRTKQAWVFR